MRPQPNCKGWFCSWIFHSTILSISECEWLIDWNIRFWHILKRRNFSTLKQITETAVQLVKYVKLKCNKSIKLPQLPCLKMADRDPLLISILIGQDCCENVICKHYFDWLKFVNFLPIGSPRPHPDCTKSTWQCDRSLWEEIATPIASQIATPIASQLTNSHPDCESIATPIAN